MASFEYIYGQPCRTSLIWDRIEDMVLLGPYMTQEMKEQIKSIGLRIKEAQYWQKRYDDVNHIDHGYEVGDIVFLWVKLQKSSFMFGKGAKLSPRLMGPFKAVENKGLMACQLALPDYLRCMHNVFHVSDPGGYRWPPTFSD
jgi:hypothetical protein